MSYAIRDIAVIGDELAKKGKKIYYLNIGDPVNPDVSDFKTPDYIIEALVEAAKKGYNMYGNSLGVYELREKIAAEENRRNDLDLVPDDVLLTGGVSEAIFFVASALVEEGDEILVPGPVYPPYMSYARFFGGTPVEYKLDEARNWQPDIDDFASKISKKTQFILLCSPNNPTGALYDEKFTREIGKLAAEYNIPLVSDEIYDQILFEKFESYKCHVSILKNDLPIIGMNGFSKAHLSTGWRLGYMYFHDPQGKLEQVKRSIEALARIRLCVNVPAQYAAIKTMEEPKEHTKVMVEKLWKRRDFCIKRLKEIPGISCVIPDGAFYLFPRLDFLVQKRGPWKDDKEFVLDLLKETGIMAVYGSGFGKYGVNHLRMTFLPPIDVLDEVFNLLEAFLRRRMP
ncbi:MAG: aminotransferase class I/II-fold pyridoxal phosphate-dependent enzyme [Candidatus Lokiarchaeota archaeon]|nr:aminotransferase class I/II-fold pyridoxal phosphate-dependent enzyme [Candidatus Lokiarchaeota archaeon]